MKLSGFLLWFFFHQREQHLCISFHTLLLQPKADISNIWSLTVPHMNSTSWQERLSAGPHPLLKILRDQSLKADTNLFFTYLLKKATDFEFAIQAILDTSSESRSSRGTTSTTLSCDQNRPKRDYSVLTRPSPQPHQRAKDCCRLDTLIDCTDIHHHFPHFFSLVVKVSH